MIYNKVMFILYSTIVGLPVYVRSTGSKQASIKDVVFDAETGRMVGLLVDGGFIFKHENVIAPVDVVKYLSDAVVIETPEAIVPVEEIVRVKNALETGPRLVNLKAETAAGKNIGKVTDILIDITADKIAKFYIHSMIKNRILPISRVVRITKKSIIFDEDTDIKAKAAMPVPAIE